MSVLNGRFWRARLPIPKTQTSVHCLQAEGQTCEMDSKVTINVNVPSNKSELVVIKQLVYSRKQYLWDFLSFISNFIIFRYSFASRLDN